MQDLMELVEKCPVAEVPGEEAKIGIEMAEDLQALGFQTIYKKIAGKVHMRAKMDQIAKHRYIKISEEAIKEFIVGKAAAYDKINKREYKRTTAHQSARSLAGLFMEEFRPTASNPINAAHDNTDKNLACPGINDPTFGSSIYSAPTIHALSSVDGTIGKFIWEEVRIEDYAEMPPPQVLEALRAHQDRKIFDYFTIAKVNAVKDPLLLGRLKGCKDRFFIAQWGEDVALDDLI